MVALLEEPVEEFDDEIDGYNCHFVEMARHEYTNCWIGAGFVEGHPDDALYLRFHRHSEPGTEGNTLILLRPDEVARVAAVCSLVLGYHLERAMPDDYDSDLEAPQ